MSKDGYQITLPSAFIPKVVKTIFFNSVTFTFRLLTTIFCIHIMARKHFNFLLQFVIVEIIFAVQTVASLKQVFSHSVVAGDFILTIFPMKFDKLSIDFYFLIPILFPISTHIFFKCFMIKRYS